MPKKRTSRHVMAVTRSGRMHVNPSAFEQDEEIISDLEEDSSFAFDDDRETPYRILFQEGSRATLTGFVQCYTGGTRGYLRDGRWLYDKAKAIFYEHCNGLGVRKALGLLSNRRVGMWILGAGGAISVLLLLLSFHAIEVNKDLELNRHEREAAQGARDQADAAQNEAIEQFGPGALPGDGFVEDPPEAVAQEGQDPAAVPPDAGQTEAPGDGPVNELPQSSGAGAAAGGDLGVEAATGGGSPAGPQAAPDAPPAGP